MIQPLTAIVLPLWFSVEVRVSDYYFAVVQAPVLFTGSIRSNLDPLGQHSDSEIWTALRRSHLYHAIESSTMGLDMALLEGGAPLSAGQKQLLTLTRALLTRSKVIKTATQDKVPVDHIL